MTVIGQMSTDVLVCQLFWQTP